MNNDVVEASRLERRPLASRSTDWAQWLAARLTLSRITPNQISVLLVASASFASPLFFHLTRYYSAA